jgi:hypothetical protein
LQSDGSDAGAEQTPSSEHVSLSAVTVLLERRARNSVSNKVAIKNFMVKQTNGHCDNDDTVSSEQRCTREEKNEK